MSRALIVEDEAMILMMIEEMLADLGHEAVARAARLADGLAQARQEAIDFAILDLNINGESSIPVAEALAARGVPFVFATGYGEIEATSRFPEAPVLTKPFTRARLSDAIAGLKL